MKSHLKGPMGLMLWTGIASGIPLLITGSTLQVWLKELNFSVETVGLLASVGIPYSLKFLWAPLLDFLKVPGFGRRKGWLLIVQFLLAISIAALGMYVSTGDVNTLSLSIIYGLSFTVCFFSATQDIILDAYRREYLETPQLGLGSSFFVTGFRIGMMLTGAVALDLAERTSWQNIYLMFSGMMVVCLISTFFIPEPVIDSKPRSLKEAVVGPILDFFGRQGAWWLLGFILLYKLGDNLAAALTPFYVIEMGYTKGEYGRIGKMFGLAALILGGMAGGAALLRWSMVRCLYVFGTLQAFSTIGFVFLKLLPPSTTVLASVIAMENFTAGLGQAAFVALMGAVCNVRFTGTQYALLSSLMGVPRTVIGSSSGFLVAWMGWQNYYIFCTLIAIPGLMLIKVIAPWTVPAEEADPAKF